MKYLKLIEGPHLMYVGGGGQSTFGITVQRTDEVPYGYQRQWEMNDYSFASNPDRVQESLGLTPEEYDAIAQELRRLIAEDRAKLRLKLEKASSGIYYALPCTD